VKRAEALDRQFQTTQQSYRSLLQRVSIFSTLSTDGIDRLCSRMQTERFTPGQAVIRQGEIVRKPKRQGFTDWTCKSYQ
jgi:hypothetical protein